MKTFYQLQTLVIVDMVQNCKPYILVTMEQSFYSPQEMLEYVINSFWISLCYWESSQ